MVWLLSDMSPLDIYVCMYIYKNVYIFPLRLIDLHLLNKKLLHFAEEIVRENVGKCKKKNIKKNIDL